MADIKIKRESVLLLRGEIRSVAKERDVTASDTHPSVFEIKAKDKEGMQLIEPFFGKRALIHL